MGFWVQWKGRQDQARTSLTPMLPEVWAVLATTIHYSEKKSKSAIKKE